MVSKDCNNFSLDEANEGALLKWRGDYQLPARKNMGHLVDVPVLSTITIYSLKFLRIALLVSIADISSHQPGGGSRQTNNAQCLLVFRL